MFPILYQEYFTNLTQNIIRLVIERYDSLNGGYPHIVLLFSNSYTSYAKQVILQQQFFAHSCRS